MAAQATATIQKRRMIFVSDHPWSSKWWWIGAIRKTRLRKTWNEKTWMRTERASMTKIPPSSTSRTSVWVMTARPAIARDIDEAELDRGGQPGLLGGHPPQSERDGDRDRQLRAGAEPERAAADDLRVVIGEAEQGAGDGGPEDAQ